MSKKTPGIEALLQELQHTLDLMSSGDLSLEDSIKEYAKAASLIEQCHGRLQEAKLQIEDIEEHLTALEGEDEL